MKLQTARKSKPKLSLTQKSELVCVVSDLHFDLQDPATWSAFCKFVKDVKPAKIVVNGDFVDLGMLSRYPQKDDSQVYAIEQIKAFVVEINKLTQYSDIYILEGNHEDRFSKSLKGDKQFVFKDAKGLTLREQCYAQGLSAKITWLFEGGPDLGARVGSFLVRHGDAQSNRFGGGKHVAMARLEKGIQQNEVFGHFHVGQMVAKVQGNKTVISIANPSMTGDHDYAQDPNWQRGFTILEVYGTKHQYTTPHLIFIINGHFAWNGKVYDGNSK